MNKSNYDKRTKHRHTSTNNHFISVQSKKTKVEHLGGFGFSINEN